MISVNQSEKVIEMLFPVEWPVSKKFNNILPKFLKETKMRI